jgi:hypothetical protein
MRCPFPGVERKWLAEGQNDAIETGQYRTGIGYSQMSRCLRGVMDSPQHCKEQAEECLRLVKLAQSKDQAEVLRNLSGSWSRLAGQIDRYNALVREQSCAARK